MNEWFAGFCDNHTFSIIVVLFLSLYTYYHLEPCPGELDGVVIYDANKVLIEWKICQVNF